MAKEGTKRRTTLRTAHGHEGIADIVPIRDVPPPKLDRSKRRAPAEQDHRKLSEDAASSPVRPDLSLLDARVPSHDDPSLGGHAKRWNVESGRNFYNQIIRFVEHNPWGFEDMGNYVRWCVLFGTDYLERLVPPDGPSNMQVLKAIAIENSASETRRNFLTSIERSSDEAFQLIGLGMEDEALAHISRLLDHVRRLPKNSAWRQLYEQTVQLRFGHLFKLSKIASLAELVHPGVDTDE